MRQVALGGSTLWPDPPITPHSSQGGLGERTHWLEEAGEVAKHPFHQLIALEYPDESLLEVVPEVVEMVFVEVFLIYSESWRLVTRQVGCIAPRPCQTAHAVGWSC